MTHTPTEQANIDAMYRFMEAEAVQDWDTVYQFIAPDCVSHSPTGVVRGHEAMHKFDDAMFRGLASWKRTILSIVADGDTVVFRFKAEATLRPSGKRAEWEALSWARMKDGQIVEGWQYFDSVEVRRQMTPPKEGTS